MERRIYLAALRPEHGEEYLALHRAIWPELLERYKQAGYRRISLYLSGLTLVLISEAEDHQAVEARLANDTVALAWQRLTGPMKQPDDFQAMQEVCDLIL